MQPCGPADACSAGAQLRYSEPGGARRDYHGGFWHSCGAAGCRYIKPTVARPFQNSSQAFYFLTIIIACAGCMVLLVAVTRARKRRHSELAKAAGLVFLLAGLCGVIAMSSYVGKTNDTVRPSGHVACHAAQR